MTGCTPNTDRAYWAEWRKGVSGPDTLYVGWENEHGEKSLTRADGDLPAGAFTLYATWYSRHDDWESARRAWADRNLRLDGVNYAGYVRRRHDKLDPGEPEIQIGPAAEDCEPPKLVHFCWPPSEKNPNPVELVVDDPALAEALVENGRPWAAAQVRRGEQILYSYNEDDHELNMVNHGSDSTVEALLKMMAEGRRAHFGGEKLNRLAGMIHDLQNGLKAANDELESLRKKQPS